jgi:multicomponent K+:H+ antiporter subunit A
LCLLVGIFPAWSVGALLASAAGATLQSTLPVYDLKIWHGFNLAFLMSLIALAGGVGLYMMRSTLMRWNDQLPTISSRTFFERVYQNLAAYAEKVLLVMDNGSLQRYMAVFFLFVFIYGAWAFISGGSMVSAVSSLPLDIASGIAFFALALGALGAVFMHHRRLLSIILIGIVGLVVALIFVRFSAPDLALTQLSVEVVTTVLMLLALHYLPQYTPKESSKTRVVRDVLLALGIGLGMAFVSFELLTSSFSTISDFYLQQSVPGGGGSNVVNVILVDFRGFDTLGEITVLAMAALGTHALLNQLRLMQPMSDSAGRLWAEDAHPLFLKMLMRPLLPLALAVAVYIFLRGHNLPGGGFVAGLVTGVALILQSLAGGFAFAEDRLPKSYPPILGLGLAMAAGVGLISWFFVRPFLTSAHGHIEIPLVGDIELASVIIFDLGVYLVVVATVLLILTELGRLNMKGARV